MKKISYPVFSPIIEHEIMSEQQSIRVHKVFWQLLCKRYHLFFGTLEVDRNKHFKKLLFSGEKIFGPCFPLISNTTNVRKLSLRVTSCFGLYCGTYRSILLGPKRLFKTQVFEEQGNLSTEKNSLTVFSRIIEYGKPQRTIYKGPKGLIAMTVEVIRSVLFMT